MLHGGNWVTSSKFVWYDVPVCRFALMEYIYKHLNGHNNVMLFLVIKKKSACTRLLPSISLISWTEQPIRWFTHFTYRMTRANKVQVYQPWMLQHTFFYLYVIIDVQHRNVHWQTRPWSDDYASPKHVLPIIIAHCTGARFIYEQNRQCDRNIRLHKHGWDYKQHAAVH